MGRYAGRVAYVNQGAAERKTSGHAPAPWLNGDLFVAIGDLMVTNEKSRTDVVARLRCKEGWDYQARRIPQSMPALFLPHGRMILRDAWGCEQAQLLSTPSASSHMTSTTFIGRRPVLHLILLFNSFPPSSLSVFIHPPSTSIHMAWLATLQQVARIRDAHDMFVQIDAAATGVTPDGWITVSDMECLLRTEEKPRKVGKETDLIQIVCMAACTQLQVGCDTSS